MGKKREDEIISFQLFKETVMMICMLIPFNLYQYDLLSLFHLVLLGVLILGKLFLSAGKRRKTRTPGKIFPNWISRKRRFLNLNGTYTVISGYGKERLFISTEEIAKGSNETVIFEGEFQGRRVAVKRLLKDLHIVALKEVQHLIVSDQHPNIVRFHGVKYDKDYVYLALERCICSLTDLISLHADSLQNSDHLGHHQAVNMQNVNLWKSNGYPSAFLLKLMGDVVNGLVHLHDLGIIHQDIKPQNVMIANGNGICAKLSDIGISRSEMSDKSPSRQNAAGSVSSGWGVQKQKFHKCQRWAADMYSLGCVFFFCLTRGGHPFDQQHKQDSKVRNNRVNLHLVGHMPEAVDLLSRLLHSAPKMRPKALQVLHHPLFWDSDKRLSFLRDVSDRLKLERRSNILITLEKVAKRTFGDGWDKNMESELIKDINRCRPYRYNSVQQLLRVVRNMFNHYHESPLKIKELLGPKPDGIDNYFSCRFPRLFMEVYKVVISNCRDMVNGLVHLHDLGIIHQDIRPQNVMIANGNGICAKLSDIGISRSDKSSSPQNAAGFVSSGWGAPEQKLHKRQRWSADMYSLGCIFYFCLTRGGHMFDHQLNHDIKVKNNRVSLHLVDHIPEAVDLLSRLLHPNPAVRPKAFQVLHHPLFWDSEKRLSFLRDVSDRLKRPKSKGTKRQRQHQHQRHSNILIALERVAKRTFGDGWDKIMESELIKDINCRPYGYKYNSVQHLLRVVRNKLNHYHESPPEIKELLGPMPEGIDNYFSCRFPRLLMEVYEVVISNFRLEKCFEKYFGDE